MEHGAESQHGAWSMERKASMEHGAERQQGAWSKELKTYRHRAENREKGDESWSSEFRVLDQHR
jgi:hypothetical protein